MTYTKQHTEGIILRRYDVGEADCGYLILTRSLGLVYARAQSVRDMKSKLRFGLQEYMVSDLSFIRGRDLWRVTHAVSEISLGSKLVSHEALRGVLSRLVRLLLKLLPIEDVQEPLYDTLRYAFAFIDTHELSEDELHNFEALIVLRLLKHLGYVGGGKRLEYLLSSPFVNDMLLYEAGRVRRRALQEINHALRELPV